MKLDDVALKGRLIDLYPRPHTYSASFLKILAFVLEVRDEAREEGRQGVWSRLGVEGTKP
jgi:hypothetical protein